MPFLTDMLLGRPTEGQSRLDLTSSYCWLMGASLRVTPCHLRPGWLDPGGGGLIVGPTPMPLR